MGEMFDITSARDAEFHMHTYARKQVMFVSGLGTRLYDDEGREYLDLVSGIGSVNLGHAHPAVAEAVARQMSRLVHVSNLYHVEHRTELAEELSALLGGGYKAFFCNSGAEACEGSIKLARRWGKANKGPDAVRIVTAERSFHGRTMAALAATGQPAKQEAFEPLPPGFVHVPFNDIDALSSVVDDTVCAVMLEVVQGEGGVYPADPAYLKAVRALCDERGALLMLDEVQSGFWRTGHAFAHQAYGVEPDVVALAKSLANGLPAGAVVARAEVADSFAPGDHGSTFGGTPVICAAARATIAALQAEALGENAIAVGAHLRAGLESLIECTDLVVEVRGAGLMLAAQLREPIAARVVDAGLARGFVLNNIGTHILRFLPPLVCTNVEVDALIDELPSILAEVAE